jgi:2-dehydro-3-deoxyphosphooctonate aldolase (KDO 8-P synthase)
MPPKKKARPRATVAGIPVGAGRPPALIAGPCVIESPSAALSLAENLAGMAGRLGVPLIFKASYDKANRTSLHSFRGPGRKKGLEVLRRIRERTGLPVLTDVHSVEEVDEVAAVADVLQIPAFLCRQTDLLLAAGATGKAVNVKKGQFLAPDDLSHIIEKVRSTGNRNIVVTERGTSFGYHRLVVDFCSLPTIRSLGVPVVFDATHSVQMPGSEAGRSGGRREMVPPLARAAAAAGCDLFFFEVHRRPDRAKSDAANSITPTSLEKLWPLLAAIDRLTRGEAS